MAVTLTSYPVITSSGKVRNIFAGFDAVELEFKREDTAIVSVTQGVDNQILISIATDITNSLNVGEWVYLYSTGSAFVYDGVFQITGLAYSAPNTEITVNGDYIEAGSPGYCNYRQNWFLESKLVNPDNNDVNLYPSLLQSDGNPNGEVKVNTSMLVDFLKNDILTESGEITAARNQCNVMYRESWREDDTAIFTLVDDHPIVIIFSAENSEIEDFVNGFDSPIIWEGYPMVVNMLHSLQNYVGERVSIQFDELDINKDNITVGSLLANFSPTSYGILQANIRDNQQPVTVNTRFIRFNAITSDKADYETGDYNDSDYFTINTP